MEGKFSFTSRCFALGVSLPQDPSGSQERQDHLDAEAAETDSREDGDGGVTCEDSQQDYSYDEDRQR